MRGIVIAGTHSGCGKTIVTIGILAALRRRDYDVQAFKAGPDFIDTGLHELITRRSSRNLDLWMCGRDYVIECFKKNSADADIAVVEGVMGLYDGNPNTADLSTVLNLPVILVIDAYGMAESAGAVVKGFYENAKLMGVIFNRVASENHYKRLKNSVQGVPVLGYLPRDLAFKIPHRHLGLIIAEENPITKENIDKLADTVLEHIDVDVIVQKCRSGEVQKSNPPFTKEGHGEINPELRTLNYKIRIAIAYDKAFCFYYKDNIELLRDAGAEIVRFSPLSDNKIPDNVDALYIGGGYPELYAKALSNNESMLKAIHAWALSGKPLYAECGGLMYLSKGIHDFDGNFYRMADVFPFETTMKKGRANLGYREILLKEDCIIGKKGEKVRGHEFHYSEIIDGTKNAEQRIKTEDFFSHLNPRTLSSLNPYLVYSVKDSSGRHIKDEGYRFKNTLASYIHIHFGSNPDIANNFMET